MPCEHGLKVSRAVHGTLKQLMWQPDPMRMAQFIIAGVRSIREIDPSAESDI